MYMYVYVLAIALEMPSASAENKYQNRNIVPSLLSCTVDFQKLLS